MRIGHCGYEIELYPREKSWLWVVFDEEGDETRSGHALDRPAAFGQARRAVAQLRSPIPSWLERFLPFSLRRA